MHWRGVRRWALVGSATASIAASSACSRPDEGRVLSGRELFTACTSCHGEDGLGNRAIAAPSIAGLPAWYVESQLVKFKTGVRGAHPDDLEGMRMRPMARQMMNDGEVKSVAAYVAQLPRTNIQPTLAADTKAGIVAYKDCVPCHGYGGLGNELMKAPPIAAQADWYVLAQLKKFRSGVRGADPRDTTGAIMRPMALALPDDETMKNVVAHVATLAR